MSKKKKEGEASEQKGQDPIDETVIDAQADNTSENELAELKDKYLRLFAEFDNYKKRTARERLDLIRTAAEDLVTKLLPVLDDFDRAKKNADDSSSSETFSEGVALVYQKLHHVLESKGLEAMDTEEKEFDPELHEAITKIPAPEAKLKGKIIDHIEKGYYLNDKIIRHAKVIIGE
ncbi:MAG: nucleotide exchange factor GrpE [Saprospiraceae bacterium]|nr:nucleotide exchange factor GrpE [Saprospiraceae bacterium]